MTGPLDVFLRYAVDSCIGPPAVQSRPSLEVLSEEGTCPKCGANTRLVDYCSECEEVERDRNLCMDQDSDKEYRLGILGDK